MHPVIFSIKRICYVMSCYVILCYAAMYVMLCYITLAGSVVGPRRKSHGSQKLLLILDNFLSIYNFQFAGIN